MLKEITETPECFRRVLKTHLQAAPGRTVDLPSLQRPFPEGHRLAGRTPFEAMAACTGAYHNRFTVIGCGSSWHAALVAEYMLEHIARIPVEAQYSSEFRNQQPIIREGDVLVIISSSGETQDSVASLRNMRSLPHGNDLVVVSIVNEADSTLARESDAFIDVMAGEEYGVTSTKALSSMCLFSVLLAVALGEECKAFQSDDVNQMLPYVKELPERLEQVIQQQAAPLLRSKEASLSIGDCALWDIACQNVLASNFIFLGRGCNWPIALEGAMKCKEIAYIHAEGMSAAEMKHGPIALIDQFMPVVVIAPESDATYEKIKANIEEVKARNGSVIVITDETNSQMEDLANVCEHVITIPLTHECLMPLVSLIPLQLLAYMMGILRGNDVDKPRGLAKVS